LLAVLAVAVPSRISGLAAAAVLVDC